MILYEILINEEPFKCQNGYQIFEKVMKGDRPTFPFKIPDAYSNLMERCWSANPNDRPNFDSIVDELKTNPDFITELVDKDDFIQYIEFIDKYQSTFDKTKNILKIEDFMQNKKSDTFKKVIRFPINQTKRLISGIHSWLFKQEKLFPIKEFNDLNETCQKVVNEAENDHEKQFLVATFLIEGKNEFPRNIEIGIKYLEKSISKGCIDSAVYFSQILIEGKLIPQDFLRAKKYLSKYLNKDDGRVFLLYGKILKKENKNSEARKYFQKGSTKGNSESMYRYGKMLILGEGGDKNEELAVNFLNLSKNNGYEKSDKYLNVFVEMKKNESFSSLQSETKYFIIKQIIKNQMTKIIIEKEHLKMLFDNNSLLSVDFINILHLFESILININYLCQDYDSIMDQISKLKNDNFSNIKICLHITDVESIDHEFGKLNVINYVNIKSSIKELKKGIFSDCSLLEKIDFSSPSLTVINEIAFCGCSSLTQIMIPSSVTTIGCKVFKGCLSLTKIRIPSSVTSIGAFAFKGCSSLTDVFLSSSLTKIEEGVFNKCCSLAEITIPSSVTEIGKSSFKKCNLLSKIKLPSSVISIGAHSFKKCKSLIDVSLSFSMTKIEESSFSKCSSLQQISIPNSVKKIGNSAFKDCSSLTSIKLTNSLLTIEGQAFCGCSSLEQISIPSSVTYVGYSAFKDCSKLKQIELPSVLSSICDNTFNGCIELFHITMPSSITSIGLFAFKGCSSLTEIKIPSSVKSICEGAFSDCSSLTEIKIPASVNEIRKSLFENCYSLNHVSIPSSVKKIDSSSFRSCKALEVIEIPSSVSSVEKDAFRECSGLKKILIPSSLVINDAGLSSDVIIVRTD